MTIGPNITEVHDTLMKGYEELDVILEVEYDGDLNPVKVLGGVLKGGMGPMMDPRELSIEELEDINTRLKSDAAYKEAIKDQIVQNTEDVSVTELVDDSRVEDSTIREPKSRDDGDVMKDPSTGKPI